VAAEAIAKEDAKALRRAVTNLEFPGLAAQLAEVIGAPIEVLVKRLPGPAANALNKTVEISLRQALKAAVSTLESKGDVPPARAGHRLAAAVSGAVGGAVGLTGLAIELPITTTIIFRSIAEIARSEGEELDDPETLLACLQVFAFGNPRSPDDDAVESGYFATRVAMAHAVREAAAYLAKGAIAKEAPIVARVIMAIASRFGIVVSYKAAAQMMPIIGALGGATVNTAFMNHFQRIADGHFTIRRLERKYGSERVRVAYEAELARQHKPLRDRRAPTAEAIVKPGDGAIDVTPRQIEDESQTP
jgi:hypothetical protein